MLFQYSADGFKFCAKFLQLLYPPINFYHARHCNILSDGLKGEVFNNLVKSSKNHKRNKDRFVMYAVYCEFTVNTLDIHTLLC